MFFALHGRHGGTHVRNRRFELVSETVGSAGDSLAARRTLSEAWRGGSGPSSCCAPRNAVAWQAAPGGPPLGGSEASPLGSKRTKGDEQAEEQEVKSDLHEERETAWGRGIDSGYLCLCRLEVFRTFTTRRGTSGEVEPWGSQRFASECPLFFC